MHKKYKKDDPADENTGQKKYVKCRNKSSEKQSAARTTKTKNKETKNEVEKVSKENRHHKKQQKERKLLEPEYIDLKDVKSKETKKAKHKDRTSTKESVFTNIENYLKSLSRTPQIQNRRSRSSENYNAKHKNKHDLRREKTIHGERTKDNSLKIQPNNHEKENRKRSKSDKRTKRNDIGDKQLFYCHIETSSPFQTTEKESESMPRHHSNRHKEKTVVDKKVKSKDARKKNKDNDIKLEKDSVAPELNVHKRKKSRTNTSEDQSKTVPILEVKSSSAHKKNRSHTKRSEEEIRSRSKRKKSCIENNTKENPHSSQHQFQEKIEDDLKSYFMRIQNLIDRKLETLLHANTSITKLKQARVDKRESREKSPACRDKNTEITHKHRVREVPEQKHLRSVTKSRNREETAHQNVPERTKTEENATKRKHDSPSRSAPAKRHHQGSRKPEAPQPPVENHNLPVEVKLKKQDKPPKEHDAPHPESHQKHSKVPSNSAKKVEKPKDVTTVHAVDISKNEPKPFVTKKERKHRPRVSEKPEQKSPISKEECDSFRVEGIEPPNLEGGKTQRDKKIRKLECKTVSIIGIPSQIKDEYTKYATGLEEALERKKKTKRFKLYYKYSVAGNNCIPSNNVHSSGDKSIVSESYKFTSEYPEDNPIIDTVKDELPPEPAFKKEHELTKNTNTKAVGNSVPTNIECTYKSARKVEELPLLPEVQCKYFKALVSSSSECSIKSKTERVETSQLTGNIRDSRYFLPDPLYKNRNYQSNLASKSDIHLSYNPTKTSTFSDQRSSMEYARRNYEPNIYNSPSTSRRSNFLPEQKVFHQHTKINDYDARIEELLNRKMFAQLENIPQRFDHYWYPPAFMGNNNYGEGMSDAPQKLLESWNPVAANDHKIFVNKEVFCGSSSQVEKQGLGQKFDKFTFFSNENMSESTKRKEEPVDMMTQKYDTCDVGTEIKAARRKFTEEVGVEVNEEKAIIKEQVDVGVGVREDKVDVDLKHPGVVAEEAIKPTKRGKEKSILTKKRTELVKPRPVPQKCKRQPSDISTPSTPDKERKPDEENTTKIDTENSEVISKVPVRRHTNNTSDLKPKSSKTPNACDVNVCKKQNHTDGKALGPVCRSSKRSATAHTFPTVRQKPPDRKWHHSLKKSQSEISFRNLNLNSEESRITSLVCMRKFLNDTKCDVSSKSNAHSLDRYFGKSFTSEAHTSSFFLTKDYKTADVSSYHRRKMYDEVIRRKLRKRGKVEDKSLAPQVFEVRFLTVDNFQSRPIDKEMPIFSQNREEFFTKTLVETKILGLCQEMIQNQNLLAVQSKFIMSDHQSLSFISSCEFCKSRPNFADFVDCLRKSLIPPSPEDNSPCEIISTYAALNDSEPNKPDNVNLKASEEFLLQSLQKSNLVLSGHASCPILKSQNSFKYLYQSESNEKGAKRPMNTILGFTLKSDTHLHRYPEITKKTCSSSGESGYESTSRNSSSFANFFKRPKIAALLEPQSDVQLWDSPVESTTYLKMMKKCQEYAQKVVVNSQVKIDAHEVYEEIPLDILLSKTNRSEPSFNQNKMQLKRYSEPGVNVGLCPPPIDDTKLFNAQKNNNEISLIYENSKQDEFGNSKSFGCLATPSLETVVSTVDPNMDEEFAQQILMTEFVICNINLGSCCVTILDQENAKSKYETTFCYNPVKLRRMMTKKFFENLLEVYEKESIFRASLMDSNIFFENELLPLISPREEHHKRNVPKNSVGKRIKVFARKLFSSKSSRGSQYDPSEKVITEAKPVDDYWKENWQSLACSTRKYFSMYVQAVRINGQINDEIKICGFQKLLEMIELGRFTFLRTSRKPDFENEIRAQAKKAFRDVYSNAAVEAKKHRRTLSSNDLKLLAAFVCKYSIGLLSYADLIAFYVGKGFFKTDIQLKGAVMYLMKNVDVDLDELEKYCKMCV